jgi:hypothetical protein
MKSFTRLFLLIFFVFSVQLTIGQDKKETDKTEVKSKTQKNSKHSGQKSIPASSEINTEESLQGNDQLLPDQSENNKMSGSKKGYDYYKAKSDLAPKHSGTRAQDHNSTRSNKTSSKTDQGGSSGEGDLNKGIDDKTDTSPAARGSKPKPKVP